MCVRVCVSMCVHVSGYLVSQCSCSLLPRSQKHCQNFVSVPEPIQCYMQEVKDQLQQVRQKREARENTFLLQ